MPKIELKNITKKFGGTFTAVDNLSITIEDGDFITLLGPSGCGKTTTLRQIAGLETPTSGEIIIDGKKVFSSEDMIDVSPSKRDVGFLFQNYALWPHMTVYKNIAFGLENLKWEKSKIDERVKELLALLKIEEFSTRYPAELSGGQQQRVAIARTLATNPRVLLMDEPLSNLDAKQRVTMRSEITDIHQKTGSTTIYVTHDQTEAMTMADRIVVMKEGYIQQVGTPYDLYFNPVNVFVAGFIGEPPMNFVRAVLKKGKITIGNNTLDLSKKLGDKASKYEGKEIVFGFRPEAIVLGKADDSLCIKASVELTELLGDNTNVYVDIQGEKSILKVNPHDTPEMDSDIEFSIPYESVYLFDGETERRI